MYRKAEKITGSIHDPSNYIQGFDVYNSKFLAQINDPNLEREYYEVRVNEYRPDLIAQDYYGSSDYMGILLLQTKMTLPNFKRGVVLKLLPKTTIDSIIKNI